DASDQSGGRRDRDEAALRIGTATEVATGLVGHAREDDRVENHDVDHREEGRQSTTDFLTERRSPARDREIGIELCFQARALLCCTCHGKHRGSDWPPMASSWRQT